MAFIGDVFLAFLRLSRQNFHPSNYYAQHYRVGDSMHCSGAPPCSSFRSFFRLSLENQSESQWMYCLNSCLASSRADNYPGIIHSDLCWELIPDDRGTMALLQVKARLLRTLKQSTKPQQAMRWYMILSSRETDRGQAPTQTDGNTYMLRLGLLIRRENLDRSNGAAKSFESPTRSQEFWKDSLDKAETVRSRLFDIIRAGKVLNFTEDEYQRSQLRHKLVTSVFDVV